MRLLRITLTALVALLVVALLAPAAGQATVKHRFWQDLSLNGPFAGRISLAIAFEDTNGNRRFKPRYASAYDLDVQTSCDAPGVRPPGVPWYKSLGGNAFSKYSYFAPALHNGRFDHRFENQAESPQTASVHGDLTGKLVWRGKWVKRIKGSFDVEDWDVYPATDSNCTSLGSYDATRCKPSRSGRDRPEWWWKWKAPICADYAM